MQDIEQQAGQTYLKNLEFLEKNHYDIWYKLHLLELATEDGRYKEKYALDYIDNYFDVMELASKNYLYASNSVEVSKKLVQQVNLKKSSFVFDGFPLYYQYEKEKENFTDKNKGLEDIYPLMTYYLDHITPQDHMIEIEKFIIIGVGLGMHIIDINTKINAEEYFIIEDDLELFKLSLFTTPYYKLNKATLFFSIGDDKEAFTKKFKTFLENSFFRNKYLKYLHFPAHPTEKIKFIKNALSSQSFASFPYKTNLDKYIRTLNYLNSGYKILNLATYFHNSTATQKPLLIIASGPSLDNNLEWLQQNHTKFIILALSATLKVLYEHKITPDIVTHLDGFTTSIEHLKGFEQKEFLSNSIAIMGAFTPPEVLQYFKQENIYLVEDHGTYYNDGFDADTGPCIGSTSIMWSVQIGFQDIYLLGIDFAISESGSSHSSTHQLTKTKYDIEDIDTISSNISFRGDFFAVQGNFREKVQTNPLFYSSILALNKTLPIIKQDYQHIYNLNDGAYLKETHALVSKDISTKEMKQLEKTTFHKEFKSFLASHSKEKLSQEDVNSLKIRLNYTLSVKEILNKYKTTPLSNQKEQYLYNLLSLSLEMFKDPTREQANLVNVYDYYLNYTMPIIFDFFNTKELQNIKKHIKKIDKILINGMTNIEKIYEEAIQNFLDTKI